MFVDPKLPYREVLDEIFRHRGPDKFKFGKYKRKFTEMTNGLGQVNLDNMDLRPIDGEKISVTMLQADIYRDRKNNTPSRPNARRIVVPIRRQLDPPGR